MRWVRLPALAVVVLAACGSEPLTVAQFQRQVRSACEDVPFTRGVALEAVRRAHRKARGRITALVASPGTQRQAQPLIERLEAQGRRLDELAQSDARGAQPARLAEIAGAIELDQRLAGEGALAVAFGGCLGPPAGLAERYALRAYAPRARVMLRRAAKFVSDPVWDLLYSDDPGIVRDVAGEIFLPAFQSDFGVFFRADAPEPVRREHMAVLRSLSKMTRIADEVEGLLESTGGTLERARRLLGRVRQARRDFPRARARLLRALERSGG